jgi:ABC-type dipeptide/oligopeptide/nickel transport system permease subunit
MPKRAAALLLALTAVAVAAPWSAPYEPGATFRGYRHAPPMPPRLSEGLAVYPLVIESLLEERFSEDRTRTVALPWSSLRSDPVFLLGADKSSRDVLSRLLVGARISLGIGLLSVVLAAALGGLVGGWAASRGGRIDEAVMRVSDLVLVLPVLYVVLVLRAVLPLVLSPANVFLLMAAIFPLVGWPVVARGVRAIVARERDREYVLAARSLAGILWRHLLPACVGHIAVQASLLLPAFILAEAALSYVGLGFPDTVPTWGTMLREAADVNELSRFPWTATPALAIFAVTLVTNLVLQRRPSDRRASPDRPLVRPRTVGERSPEHPITS